MDFLRTIRQYDSPTGREGPSSWKGALRVQRCHWSNLKTQAEGMFDRFPIRTIAFGSHRQAGVNSVPGVPHSNAIQQGVAQGP